MIISKRTMLKGAAALAAGGTAVYMVARQLGGKPKSASQSQRDRERSREAFSISCALAAANVEFMEALQSRGNAVHPFGQVLVDRFYIDAAELNLVTDKKN